MGRGGGAPPPALAPWLLAVEAALPNPLSDVVLLRADAPRFLNEGALPSWVVEGVRCSKSRGELSDIFCELLSGVSTAPLSRQLGGPSPVPALERGGCRGYCLMKVSLASGPFPSAQSQSPSSPCLISKISAFSCTLQRIAGERIRTFGRESVTGFGPRCSLVLAFGTRIQSHCFECMECFDSD